jgi:ketosteroid isomerase-like protein
VWLPPNEPPLSGKPAILQWLAGQAAAAIARIDIDDLQIFGTGSYACKLARFRTTMAAPSADGAMVVSGTHGWLLHRNAAGDWRVGVVEWTIAGTAKPES